MRVRQSSFLLSAAVLLLVCGQPAMAQTGKLIVHATPPEAHIYADGAPVVDAKGHHVCLSAGEHKIDLYNYGFKPETRTVTIEAHKTLVLNVTMQAIPGNTSGPWGCITLKGADRAAVLLNGKDPAVFYVGHGDEFNNEWGWKQELLVPPGHHELTVQCCNQDPWSVSVDVPANKRVIIDAYKGVRTTVDWSRGEKMPSMARFKAGTASAEVAVEKVTGQFNASTTQVNCGDSAHLTWSSTGAGKSEINGNAVSPSGDQTVQPTQTTDYKFTAAGPGGVYNGDATVNVNSAIPASLSVSPTEVRYHKIGEKVDQAPSATVTWSAPNASTVSVDPLGAVGTSGNRELPITPSKTSPGAIDENVTYTLHASNTCGGSETRSATLHITGSYEVQAAVNEAVLETKLTFNSIYYPTNLPTVKDPQGGLVPGQSRRLDEIVTNFKEYLTVRPEANLLLEAHADLRGSVAFNKTLSQRRADLVKSYLVEHGVPAEKITTTAFGKEKNLTNKQVEDLTAQNPNLSPEDRKRVDSNIAAFRLANNRRVDLRLSTTGQTSQQFYPYNSDDLNVLLGEKKPVAKKVMAKKAPAKK
ncbi:MAG: OmpA family protein [Terriglobia bacterium]|jgi:outer membrane protein OmpA-like peptidoglycan-associated protein